MNFIKEARWFNCKRTIQKETMSERFIYLGLLEVIKKGYYLLQIF